VPVADPCEGSFGLIRQGGSAPSLVDSGGKVRSGRVSGRVECLELDECELTEAVLASAAVVGGLDPGDGRQPQGSAGRPASGVENVLLQPADERLHRSVVGADPDPPHDPRRPWVRSAASKSGFSIREHQRHLRMDVVTRKVFRSRPLTMLRHGASDCCSDFGI
jgi:hypothetical protein